MKCSSSQAERGAAMVECLNRGLAASSAPIVHILTCGVQVCPGWADAALRHFGNPDIAAVGAMVLRRDDRRRTISAGLGYCAGGTAWRLEHVDEAGVAAGQQAFCGPDTLAAFYRRSVVQSLGGLSSWAGDSLAGIDLALALRHAGFRCVLEPRCVTHIDAAATYVEPAFRRGRNVEKLFWRWAASQGWLSSLAAHVALLGWPVHHGALASVDVRPVGRSRVGCAATDFCERTFPSGRIRSGEEALGHRRPAFQHRAFAKSDDRLAWRDPRWTGRSPDSIMAYDVKASKRPRRPPAWYSF